MSVRSAHPWGRPPVGGRKRLTAAAMLGAALLLAASMSVAGPAGATTSVAPTGSAQVSDNSTALTVTVAASVDAPGYRIVVSRSPFQVTTQRSDGTVLQTTTGIAGSSGPVDFLTASGWQTATTVQGWSWQDGGLDLTLATTVGVTIDDRIVPQPDRYRMTWSAPGCDPSRQPLRCRVGGPLVRAGRGDDPGWRTIYRPAVAAGFRCSA